MKEGGEQMPRKAKVATVILLVTLLLPWKIGYGAKKEALDPMGYAGAGYYGKTQEELKELLPGIETISVRNMVLESEVKEGVSCKQVFYFCNGKLTEILYEYVFERGEEAEEMLVEQCKQLREIDRNAIQYGVVTLGEVSIEQIEDGFWTKVGLVRTNYSYDNGMGYGTYCDAENTRELNREAEPEGWKNEYNVKVYGEFYHLVINWYRVVTEDEYYYTPEKCFQLAEEGAPRSEFEKILDQSSCDYLGGKEARITLRIATWD